LLPQFQVFATDIHQLLSQLGGLLPQLSNLAEKLLHETRPILHSAVGDPFQYGTVHDDAVFIPYPPNVPRSDVTQQRVRRMFTPVADQLSMGSGVQDFIHVSYFRLQVAPIPITAPTQAPLSEASLLARTGSNSSGGDVLSLRASCTVSQ